MGVAVFTGWALLWALGRVLNATVILPEWRLGIMTATVLLAVGAAVAVGGYARRRPDVAADLVVVLTSVTVAGLATVALHGTRWGFSSLWGDSYFRTQMATRYSENVGLVDYSYRDLPAYYPPALGWLQGRLADLFGVAAWEVMKPTQLILAAGIPLLAYLFWRRVIPPWPAALVVMATTLLTAHLQKPDEWLVLACVLPWWLEIVRGARNPAVREWSSWRHGLVLGLLLLTHTYYFLPLGVATLLGLVVDLLRRRGLPLPVTRALFIGGIGLVISAPYWFQMVAARISDAPSDTLQMRYGFEGANEPPQPATFGIALLWAVALGWLLWSAWRWQRHGRTDRLAGGLALALGGAYLTLLAGAVAERFDIGLLAFKSEVLVIAVQTACGVLGLLRVCGWLLHRPTRKRAAQLAVPLIGAALAVTVVSRFATTWVIGEKALRTQITRYPDGTWPEGRAGQNPFWYPAQVLPGDPSVTQLVAAWDRLSPAMPRSETVLVTTRVDLLATTPVYAFVPLKSIYSHPHAQFEARLALLQQAAECSNPRCAADLLQDNPYDRVDGLILERNGDALTLGVYVDNFPNLHTFVPVDFAAELFKPPHFQRTDLGRVSVIAVQ